MTTPGGPRTQCQSVPATPPCSAHRLLYHRVGASMANGLRPLDCSWPRCFVYHTIAFGAAFTLPCCALRGTSGGATKTIEALVDFGSPILPRPGFFLCTLLGVRRGAAYIRQPECDH